MSNQSIIKYINDAKNSRHNNEKLTEEEKAALDSPFLIIQLKEISRVLWLVKEARNISSEKTERIIELLGELEKVKNDNWNDKVVYKSINNNNQFDKAIARLNEIKYYGTFLTINDLRNEICRLTADIKMLEITERRKKDNHDKTGSLQARDEKEKLGKKLDNLNNLKKEMELQNKNI